MVREPPTGMVSVTVPVKPRPVRDVTTGFPSSPNSLSVKAAGTEPVLTRMIVVVHPPPSAMCEMVAVVAAGGAPETVKVTGIERGALVEFCITRATVPE